MKSFKLFVGMTLFVAIYHVSTSNLSAALQQVDFVRSDYRSLPTDIDMLLDTYFKNTNRFVKGVTFDKALSEDIELSEFGKNIRMTSDNFKKVLNYDLQRLSNDMNISLQTQQALIDIANTAIESFSEQEHIKQSVAKQILKNIKIAVLVPFKAAVRLGAIVVGGVAGVPLGALGGLKVSGELIVGVARDVAYDTIPLQETDTLMIKSLKMLPRMIIGSVVGLVMTPSVTLFATAVGAIVGPFEYADILQKKAKKYISGDIFDVGTKETRVKSVADKNKKILRDSMQDSVDEWHLDQRRSQIKQQTSIESSLPKNDQKPTKSQKIGIPVTKPPVVRVK